MSLPRFSHLRVGSLGTFHDSDVGDLPVKVTRILDGNSATVVVTAERPTISKGTEIFVTDNLSTQHLTTRTRSVTTLLVF